MKKAGMLLVLVLVLAISGCSKPVETPQALPRVQPQVPEVVYAKPTNISGAQICNNFSANIYELNTQDAQKLYKTLESLTTFDTESYYDSHFLNIITFYGDNKEKVLVITAIDPRGSAPYPLLINKAGKVLSSETFYVELSDIAKRNKLDVYGLSGG